MINLDSLVGHAPYFIGRAVICLVESTSKSPAASLAVLEEARELLDREIDRIKPTNATPKAPRNKKRAKAPAKESAAAVGLNGAGKKKTAKKKDVEQEEDDSLILGAEDDLDGMDGLDGMADIDV